MKQSDMPPPLPPQPEITPAYNTRLQAALSRPDMAECMFLHIANGGNLITMCDTMGLRYSDVAAWIDADPGRMKRYNNAALLGQEWIRQRILAELQSMALADKRKIYRPDGSMLPPAEWPDDVAKTIEGIEVEELFGGRGAERTQIGYTRKVKLAPKLPTLELMGKEIGMFVTRAKVEVSQSLEDLVGGSWDAPPVDVTPKPEALPAPVTQAAPTPTPEPERPPDTIPI